MQTNELILLENRFGLFFNLPPVFNKIPNLSELPKKRKTREQAYVFALMIAQRHLNLANDNPLNLREHEGNAADYFLYAGALAELLHRDKDAGRAYKLTADYHANIEFSEEIRKRGIKIMKRKSILSRTREFLRDYIGL